MGIFPELARLLAEQVLNGLPQGVLIALAAWGLLRILGRRNASTRFAVWFVALLLIAALPWLGSWTSHAASVGTGPAHSAITLSASWATGFLLIWATIAGLALLRVALGLWQLRNLRAHSEPVDLGSLDPLPRRTVAEFQSIRPVKLAFSKIVRVPAAIGFFRPLIVLPSWSLQELSTEELHSILLHELAHLRRRDDWTNLAQKMLRALFFFHPAIWWADGQLSLEREMACDDAVLSHAGSNRRAYAQCLISLAEKNLLHRGLALAQAAVGRLCQTSQRVAQILNVHRLAGTRVWKPAVGLVTVVSVACIAGLERAPRLVTFHDSTAAVSLASAAIGGVANGMTIGPQELRETVGPRPVRKSGFAAARKTVGITNHPKALATGETVQAKLASPPMQYSPAHSQADVVVPEMQTVFVVMHTRQWDGSSSQMMTISVWRLTVIKAVLMQRTTAPAKST